MMVKYSKPMVIVDQGLAEGVYAASHQNPSDNIGLGDLVVTSDAGLAITGVSITD